ncbi:lipocalin/fatty acid-binding family protein [Microbacterium paludicola]|uniref:hypothetical protein n=1 Tax=Microbacterium paludicola TaxID=300019 RepID=UPI00188438FB|nr:hypothetical protein [Microbacterium paludicola]MBF0816886.1 hypothetical protein [Microbacterium paludicola]
MRRRTGEETRQLLLSIGLDMLFERGAAIGVEHIRLQEVLRRAGLTTGAAYRLWADQTEYQHDLALAMLRLRFADPIENATAAVEQLMEDGADVDTIIRAASGTHALDSERRGEGRGSRDTEAFLLALALRASGATTPELRAASRERHEESVEGFSRFYERLMKAYGYRMKTPYTVRDFTEAMAALGEGFAIHALEGIEHPRLDIAVDDEAPTGRWSLFGLAVRALAARFMTRDVPTTSDESPEATAADDSNAETPAAPRSGADDADSRGRRAPLRSPSR